MDVLNLTLSFIRGKCMPTCYHGYIMQAIAPLLLLKNEKKWFG